MNFKQYAKRLNDITFLDYYNRLKLLAQTAFKWNNLPNGMDEKWIEQFLFSEGKCIFFKDPVLGFMVTKCADSGILNPYDEPTKLTPIATNYYKNGQSYENGVDCVLIRNNDSMLPTHPTIQLYAYRLADITRTIDINVSAQKTPILIECSEKQRLTLKNVYAQWNENEPVIFGSKDLDLSGLKVLNTGAPAVFDKLQIQKHHIWNEVMTFLGINNANMDKRERLVDDEVQANNEQVEMFAQTMLKSREKACEQINALFGTNISVEYRNTQTANMDDLGGNEDGTVHD